MTKKTKNPRPQYHQSPNAEQIAEELSTARTMDDFFGREGIFARLFAKTIEEMMSAELSEHLGYEKYGKVHFKYGTP